MKRGRDLAVALMLTLAAFPFAAASAGKDDAAAGEENLRGDAASGASLYKRYCRGCHGEEGKGDGLVFMPHVNNLTKKGYIDQLPDTYLMLAIAKGGPGIGKSSYMPSFEDTLTTEQRKDLIAYIRSLPLY